MEQILYLLVGAGWLLFNLYKKSQDAKAEGEAEARQQGQPRTMEQPEQPVLVPQKSFEDLIREQLGERVSTPQVVAPRPAKVSPSPFLTNDAPKYAEGKRPRVVRRAEKVKVQERPKVFQSDLLGEELDMRKAFIYNTILQRPYA